MKLRENHRPPATAIWTIWRKDAFHTKTTKREMEIDTKQINKMGNIAAESKKGKKTIRIESL